MGEQERDEIAAQIRKMYEIFASGDRQAYRECFHDDIVWHVPGDNPVSGEYRGKQAYFETMPARMQPLDEWRFRVDDVIVNEKASVAMVDLHLWGRREKVVIETDGYHLIRLVDGKIVEGWGFTEDQTGLDTLFSS